MRLTDGWVGYESLSSIDTPIALVRISLGSPNLVRSPLVRMKGVDANERYS